MSCTQRLDWQNNDAIGEESDHALIIYCCWSSQDFWNAASLKFRCNIWVPLYSRSTVLYLTMIYPLKASFIQRNMWEFVWNEVYGKEGDSKGEIIMAAVPSMLLGWATCFRLLHVVYFEPLVFFCWRNAMFHWRFAKFVLFCEINHETKLFVKR